MLALFAGLLLAVSLHFLSAIGHFPKASRTPEIGTGAGPVILYGTIALLLPAVAYGAWLIWRSAPWYAVVLGGGAAVLFAPLILQNFSDRFVDGRPALIVFAVLACLALLGMWLIA
jgi:hypothetical protein